MSWRGYIFLYDEGLQQFTLNTWSKGVMQECTIVNPQICYELEKTGIWGEAVRQRRPIVLNDFQADHPLKKGYPEGHAKLLKYLTVPVLSDNRIVAVVGVANKEQDYDNTDALQLTLLMDGVWKVLDRQQSEAALRRAESERSVVFNNMAVGALIQLADGTVSAANAAAERILGVTQDQFHNPEAIKANLRAIHEDGSPYPVEEHPSIVTLRTGQPIKNAVMGIYSPSEGDYRWININTVPQFRSGESKPYEVFITFDDITERKRAEEALRQKTEELDRYFNSALDLLCIADVNGYFQRLNPEWENTLGYSLEELQGSRFLDFVHPDDLDATIEAVDELSQQTPVFNFTNRYRHRDGSYRWIEWRAHPVGELIYAVARDVTEQRSLEERLRQAQKMEAVGRLAGGVAHDFNNMLTVILGHTESALEAVAANSPLHHDLLEIKQAAQRSADLTSQLLAFARKQPIAPRVLDLNNTVASMLKILQRLIGENIELSWHPEHNLWNVRVDPAQVHQILVNLVLNARDAIAGAGQVIIETGNVVLDEAYCSAHPDCPPGEYVRLEVSDTGIGMSEEVLAHLFEPFFTTKELGKGTGLGLATIYGIIKQNGGHVSVYSEPGWGTTFRIYLPRLRQESGQAVSGESAAEVPQGTETVLVVEDEERVLHLAKRMLVRQGYTVLTANTPGQALKLMAEHGDAIHLLISDVIMPEMNGQQLLARLMTSQPGLKYLFMSGYPAEVITQHDAFGEAVNYLAKPFSARDLATAVRRALDS